MITQIHELIEICTSEIQIREYRDKYASILYAHWLDVEQWMSDNGILEFSRDVGYKYCDLMIGTHLVKKELTVREKELLRSVYMLISYQEDGDFCFRSPSVERVFSGECGELALLYFRYAENELHLSFKTIDNKKLYLYRFTEFLNLRHITLSEINLATINDFYKHYNLSEAEIHNCIHCLRGFFHFLHIFGKTEFDYSIFVLADNYKRHRKLPTTYTTDEIKRILQAVNRHSAIGKRDYLVILLAVEYGWRSSDITGLKFENIDWDNNVIRIIQQKTGITADYPLLSTVGNAIIDYVKNGRPESDYSNVIVSAQRGKMGMPLTSPTIHSIVSRYMREADISDWKKKKHGAHSLRHSMATNMLERNISLPTISAILGHQTTESTKVYISLDENKLKQCSLDIPAMTSVHYGGA